jgi:hypothetical protein
MLSSILLSLAISATPNASGAARLLTTASTIEASSSAPLRQKIKAQAWLAVTTASLQGDPAQGPPPHAITSTSLLTEWGVTCLEAASSLPNSPETISYAFAQADEAIRLLATDNPPGAARVCVLAGELAFALNKTKRAREFAIHAGDLVEWRANPIGSGNGSLAMLLASIQECDLLSRLGEGVPASHRAQVAAAAATQPACAASFKELLNNTTFDATESVARLLYELHATGSAEAATQLAARCPAVKEFPELQLLLTQILMLGGDLEGGYAMLGGKDLIDNLRSGDRAQVLLAQTIGMARTGELVAARDAIADIGGIDRKFFAAIEIDSRRLDRGEIEPSEVLADFTTLRAVRTGGLDPFIAAIATHPNRLDRVAQVAVASGQWDLLGTLLKPLFQAKGQSGDDWLEQRIAFLARTLSRTNTQLPDAWSAMISQASALTRVDSQVEAICAMAAWWHAAFGDAPLSEEMQAALISTLETIALEEQP